jgi:hypothetical protein
MEKGQPWKLGGMEMTEFIVIVFLLTGMLVWGFILFVLLKIWLEK